MKREASAVQLRPEAPNARCSPRTRQRVRAFAFGPVAQLVERRILNSQVEGSTPSRLSVPHLGPIAQLAQSERLLPARFSVRIRVGSLKAVDDEVWRRVGRLPIMLSFRHSAVLRKKGTTTFVTRLDRDCENFEWIIGKDVEVGGCVHRVIGVQLMLKCHGR